MLTLTIVMMSNGTVLDIMVKPELRIRDALSVLRENGRIMYWETGQTYIRSWRLGRLINQFLTFKQAKVQPGDILYIESV